MLLVSFLLLPLGRGILHFTLSSIRFFWGWTWGVYFTRPPRVVRIKRKEKADGNTDRLFKISDQSIHSWTRKIKIMHFLIFPETILNYLISLCHVLTCIYYFQPLFRLSFILQQVIRFLSWGEARDYFLNSDCLSNDVFHIELCFWFHVWVVSLLGWMYSI